jgi:hypothetical protein
MKEYIIHLLFHNFILVKCKIFHICHENKYADLSLNTKYEKKRTKVASENIILTKRHCK